MSGYPHTLRPELHKALKDAGIDFWVAQGLTFWNCKDGRECVAYGYQSDGRPRLAINVVGLTTPEQAIAATLGDTDATPTRQGVGTSHDVGRYCFTCSECGHTMSEPHHMFNRNDPNVMPNFCPNCGRKVIDE